jgi:hypothetical protein
MLSVWNQTHCVAPCKLNSILDTVDSSEVRILIIEARREGAVSPTEILLKGKYK